MTYNVEHLFICLFAICISSLVRCLLRSWSHFFIGLLVFLLLNRKSSLYILNNSPLSNILSFANSFSQSVVLPSYSLNTVFHRPEIFNFKEVQLINYFFTVCTFGVISKKSLPHPVSVLSFQCLDSVL